MISFIKGMCGLFPGVVLAAVVCLMLVISLVAGEFRYRLHVWKDIDEAGVTTTIVKDNYSGCEYLLVNTRDNSNGVAITPLLHTCKNETQKTH